ncbi:multiple inositol polyphosphate phosphatase 1-like [Trichogramma pretiosum]|uniref:multiple inositol polyphosphate phosphatase 1-like n=1 Tax=Trichogramma pretiosum TaxID=7493 RepID=UPI0006C94111|nr:multiple inositol polyphosphate phosphatase 1-like [Trichogramma pretiosum]
MYSSLILLYLLGAILVSGQQKCYNKSTDFYALTGTRTPYHLVGGTLERPKKKCEPLQVWAIIRHGTRYLQDYEVPEYGIDGLEKIRDEIVENHQRGAGHLCSEDVEKIRSWRFTAHIRPHDSDDMTELGHYEMSSLGTRLKNFFPEIFDVDPDQVTPDDFQFQATNFTRTIESMKSFQRGFFGKVLEVESKVPLTNDALLIPQKQCPAWKKKNRPADVNKERDTFTNGPEFDIIKREVAEKLGYNEPLSFEKIKPMYEMCRWEAAWFPNETSTWCMAFTKEHLKYYEYREDLNYYYCCGPAQRLSQKLGCLTLSDMFNHFESKKQQVPDEPRGVFYFVHTLSNQQLMAALGIAKYPEFDGTSYSTAANRTYRNSFNAAFGTQLMAIFYKCEEDEKSPYKVQFQQAEKVIPMDGCDDEGLCDWEYLKSKFGRAVQECSMDVCYQNLPNRTTPPIYF